MVGMDEKRAKDVLHHLSTKIVQYFTSLGPFCGTPERLLLLAVENRQVYYRVFVFHNSGVGFFLLFCHLSANVSSVCADLFTNILFILAL